MAEETEEEEEEKHIASNILGQNVGKTGTKRWFLRNGIDKLTLDHTK
jgi:hypothetical protein